MDSYTQYIRASHAGVIDCIHEVYATLIELHYFHPDEIVYPPYGVPGKPSLAVSELKQLGFTDEVVALLGEIPYPSNELLHMFSHQEEGVPIAPDSAVVSYLAGADVEAIRTSRQPFRDGEVGIPAWAVKITACGLGIGTNYIYDTRLKAMVRWDSQNSYEYADQPYRPPHDGRDIMVGDIRSLDWLPWRFKYGHFHGMNIYTRPSLKQHLSSRGATNRHSLIDGEGDEDLTMSHDSPREVEIDWTTMEDSRGLANRKMEIARAVQDRYHYKRNLYQDCGWPNHFQGEEFEKRRLLLEKEHYDLIGILGPQAMRIQDMCEGRHLRAWYKQKAGANAA